MRMNCVVPRPAGLFLLAGRGGDATSSEAPAQVGQRLGSEQLRDPLAVQGPEDSVHTANGAFGDSRRSCPGGSM